MSVGICRGLPEPSLLNNVVEKHGGRVLVLGLRGCRLKPQRRHCIVSLSKTLYSMLSTGATQEYLSQND